MLELEIGREELVEAGRVVMVELLSLGVRLVVVVEVVVVVLL